LGETDGRDLPALLLKLAVFPILIKRISVPLPIHFLGGNVADLASIKGGLLRANLLLTLQDPQSSDRYIDRPALTGIWNSITVFPQLRYFTFVIRIVREWQMEIL